MNQSYLNSVRNTVLSSKPSTAIRLLLMVLFVFVTSNVLNAQTTQTYTTPGTYTFTVPCGVTSITVKVWGGGGGGHNSYTVAGGGGAFAQSTFNVTSGASYAITIGAGAASGSGDNGGDSSFGSIVIAKGGKGGNGGNNAGRGGQASASTGDIKYNGGNGGTSNGNGGAGGGAAAGTTNNGNTGGNGSGNTPGNGGIGIDGGGNGGNGGNTNNSGGNGASPGGGGGERGNNGGSSGSGGDGKIEVTYSSSSFQNYCTPSFNSGVRPITNVTFAGINNDSSSLINGSDLETYCITGFVSQGSTTNAISVKGNTNGNWTYNFKVYIDWNQNGVFGDNVNEITDLKSITNSSGTDTKTATGNISVPSTAIIGVTKMRVIKVLNDNTINSCFSGNYYGEAEDYLVSVGQPCPTYSITSVSATPACKTDNVATATITATPASLPIGNYTVTYSLGYNSNSTSYTAPMTVATAGSGTFIANVAIVNATSSTTIRVDKLASSSCSNNITANNVSNVSYMYPAANATTITNIYANCTSYIIQWDNKTMDKYFLDVATDSGFTNYLSGYQNKDMGNVWSHEFVGITNGATYYCRVRSNNYCGTSVNSNVYTFTKVGYNSIAAISGGATSVCVNSTTPAFTNSDSGGTWSIVNETGSATITSGGVVTGVSSGTVKVVYTKNFGSCTSSVTKSLTVIGVTITPNKVDETCPISNNGSISPVFSGGLTNVRYVKLTQKYAASQQVAEIQAFEIFTGTNVALSSGGAVASASSTYSSDYPASEVNDGIPATNGNMWHGANGINDWVQIDLKSGKNIDYLRIFNRTDCCQERGQNMLLELFDVSNNLVYSKTINLYQSGANVPVNVNVLDVSWLDGATTLNRTALDSGTYTLNYADAVGCPVSTPIVIGSTNTLSSAPTVTPTQPTCSVSTGAITVNTPLAATGITYTVTGTNPVVAAVTNATGVFSDLSAGTYDVTTTNACGTSTATSVTLEFVTNTWNGSAWSNGTPNSNQKIVFSGNYNSLGDITACSCTVTGNTKVIINSGHTLTITNEVKVVGSGPGAGSLTFENNASLVQINDAAVNSGNITYKRTTSSVLTSDYTYWSSPVFGQNLSISPSYDSGMFYSYNDFAVPEDWKWETAASEMVVGKGYIIRGPQVTGPPPPPGLYYATFKGEPNNGIKTIAIGPRETSNLLGNPYPSAIDADKFLATNSTLVEGTIYLWTHKTAIQLASNITNGTAGSGVLAYTSDDYASYNVTGGVGTGTGNFVNGVEEEANRPTGKIAAGQAFFTTSLGAGTVTFNNAMRLGSGSSVLDNTQFFKTKNPNKKTTNIIEKHRIWLNMTNKEGAFKQTLVGYVTDATNDYDSRFDGESLDGNDFIDFYSINEDKNLVIQGRALPFDEKDEVPLGYKTTIEGDFTINIDETDGLLANQEVFLEDKLTNKTVNLKQGNYTFSTSAGTFDDRFVLKYSSKTLGVDSPQDKEDGIIALYSNADKTIIIRNNGDATIHSVSLFGMSGQNIAVWDLKNKEQTNIQLPTKEVSSGIYILKMKTTTGESGKKIIVN